MVSFPSNRDGPESQDEPTLAHFGALSVESKTAVCGPTVPTVSVMVVLCVSEPEVPVTVTVLAPEAAEAEAVKVKVEVALPFAGGVTGLGENAAVTPLGSPEALSVVAELNPFWLVTVMVLVAVDPCCTLTLLGDADTVKLEAPAPTAKIKSSWSSYAPVLHDEALPR